jgi:hypothetical protein
MNLRDVGRCANISDVYLSFLFACTVSLTLVSDPTSRRFIRWILFQTFLYKLSLTLIDTEEGHLLFENFVNIFFCNTYIGIVAQSSRLLYFIL